MWHSAIISYFTLASECTNLREIETEIIKLHFARHNGEENSKEIHKSASIVKEVFPRGELNLH